MHTGLAATPHVRACACACSQAKAKIAWDHTAAGDALQQLQRQTFALLLQDLRSAAFRVVAARRAAQAGRRASRSAAPRRGNASSQSGPDAGDVGETKLDSGAGREQEVKHEDGDEAAEEKLQKQEGKEEQVGPSAAGTRWRVLNPKGVVVKHAASLTGEVVCRLECGKECVTEGEAVVDSGARWVRVVSPVDGWATAVQSSGKVVLEELSSDRPAAEGDTLAADDAAGGSLLATSGLDGPAEAGGGAAGAARAANGEAKAGAEGGDAMPPQSAQELEESLFHRAVLLASLADMSPQLVATQLAASTATLSAIADLLDYGSARVRCLLLRMLRQALAPANAADEEPQGGAIATVDDFDGLLAPKADSASDVILRALVDRRSPSQQKPRRAVPSGKLGGRPPPSRARPPRAPKGPPQFGQWLVDWLLQTIGAAELPGATGPAAVMGLGAGHALQWVAAECVAEERDLRLVPPRHVRR